MPPGSGSPGALPPGAPGSFPPGPGTPGALPPGTPGAFPPGPGSPGAFPPGPAAGANPSIPAPPAGYPPYQPPAAPKKKRGVLIAAIALGVILLLCAGGGVVTFLTLRDAESGEGAKEPAVAVDEFLTAVYQDRDAARAARLVCASSRDEKKIAAKVAEVEKQVTTYQKPRFRWTSPKVDNQTGDRATVTTKVTMTTADEKVAAQDLRFTVVRKTGWWVCEVA
ncbi:Rv0361 family membrane protein [Micromonospora sp. CPCC 205561]|uniref:Rv0361 family membrane protein n=1 Tax=Micromonospora sp. CPCC 205561 TaxID=3122407 RepID=UPI003FA611B9